MAIKELQDVNGQLMSSLTENIKMATNRLDFTVLLLVSRNKGKS
jgi:hypothetical protein